MTAELGRTLSTDALARITVGNSGAKKIGVSPIPDITAANVQAALEAIKTYADTVSAEANATIADEGTPLTQRTTINFTGPNVSATDNVGAARTDITIPSSYTTIQDEGTSVTPARQTLDFRGADVTVTDDAAGSRTRVTVASSYVTPQDEGSNLTSRPTMNFIGSLVSAVDDAANTRTNVTISAPTISDIPTQAKTKDIYLQNTASPLVANSGETLRYPINRAGTIVRVTANVVTAPTGAAITVSIKKNGAQITTVSISAGTNTANASGLSLAVADGDYITMVPTTVGSTAAGGGLSVVCEELVS